MRTRQKQRVATDTWRSLVCQTRPLQYRSKRKPKVEPRWAKQKTTNRPQPTKINSFKSGPSFCLTPDPRRAIKEGSKVINRDWFNHYACYLSHYIYVICNTFVTYEFLSELIRKISPNYIFFEFIF